MEQGRLSSLKPVIGGSPDTLILGSMPGADSLRLQQYYAHRRNFFWPIIYRILGIDRDPWEDDYTLRLAELTFHGLALWDSLASCRRKGSLDQHISEGTYNDIRSLVGEYPSVRTICCNGHASFRYFRSYAKPGRSEESDGRFRWDGRIEVYRLPSTSPVPSKNYRSLEDRLTVWQEIIPLR